MSKPSQTPKTRYRREFDDPEYRHAYLGSMVDSVLAMQIKVVREQRGLTQKELGARAGMRQSRISTMEDVNYSAWNVSTLKRLAAAFDCALEVRFVPVKHALSQVRRYSRRNLQVEPFARKKQTHHAR